MAGTLQGHEQRGSGSARPVEPGSVPVRVSGRPLHVPDIADIAGLAHGVATATAERELLEQTAKATKVAIQVKVLRDLFAFIVALGAAIALSFSPVASPLTDAVLA